MDHFHSRSLLLNDRKSGYLPKHDATLSWSENFFSARGSQKHLIKPPRDFVRAVVMHCVDVYTQVVLCPKNGDSCANVS